jgi:hypothetical protein
VGVRTVQQAAECIQNTGCINRIGGIIFQREIVKTIPNYKEGKRLQ